MHTKRINAQSKLGEAPWSRSHMRLGQDAAEEGRGGTNLFFLALRTDFYYNDRTKERLDGIRGLVHNL